MISTNDKTERRTHSEEFKQQIAQLCNFDKSKAEICREYGLAHSLLDRWIKRINATGSTRERDNKTPEEIELLKLWKENKQLKMDVSYGSGRWIQQHDPWWGSGYIPFSQKRAILDKIKHNWTQLLSPAKPYRIKVRETHDNWIKLDVMTLFLTCNQILSPIRRPFLWKYMYFHDIESRN